MLAGRVLAGEPGCPLAGEPGGALAGEPAGALAGEPGCPLAAGLGCALADGSLLAGDRPPGLPGLPWAAGGRDDAQPAASTMALNSTAATPQPEADGSIAIT